MAELYYVGGALSTQGIVLLFFRFSVRAHGRAPLRIRRLRRLPHSGGPLIERPGQGAAGQLLSPGFWILNSGFRLLPPVS
jgi:hypothetical protein